MPDKRDLLIEIGTEELPPKALRGLATSFAGAIVKGLGGDKLEHGEPEWFATPRRMAVMVPDVDCSQSDQQVQKRGPALSAAFDESGKPTRAAQGFAGSCGVSVEELETLETDKGAWLAYQTVDKGEATEELLEGIINKALASLPIPRRMRWGDNEAEFVRPVHWAVVLFGEDIVPCKVLGISAGNLTYGHRFHHPGSISLSSPDEYRDKLAEQGFVIADFNERKARIRENVNSAATACGGVAAGINNSDESLLDEVTALVEWPVAITGSFDEEFLQLPEEVLIATMQVHQKYFPVYGSETLLPNFIAIANLESKDPEEIKKGNERVIRPRLYDAAFFWQRDCTRPLVDYGDGLCDVIFQKQLGTLADKTRRISQLAGFIADQLDLDTELAQRAAMLAKCDLLTDMVGELPELQGTMGRYYAAQSGEQEEVATALDEQYMPRQAGGALPTTNTGQILAIADRLDTLVGIFAIGKPPTGEKDPFGLRRAALGSLRIMIEGGLELDLLTCLDQAVEAFGSSIDTGTVSGDVFVFMMERLRRYYLDDGVRSDVFDAVLARQPARPLDFHRRIHAVSDFANLPEADSLAAANKRIANILRQAGDGDADNITVTADGALLGEKVERDLYAQLIGIASKIAPLTAAGEYTQALRELSSLREPVDAFFDQVMVMVEDEDLRLSRLQLLAQIRNEFQQIADISRLRSA